MEYAKMLLVQMLLVGAAIAQQPSLRAAGSRFPQPPQFQPLQPQQQQFQPLPVRSAFQQQQQQAAPTQQGAFRQQTQTSKSGVETYQYITTINNGQQGQQAQQQESTRTFGAPTATRSFTEQQQQQQRFAPIAAPAPAPIPAPAPVPSFSAGAVEFANAVPAPVQQHDAQVFQRRPLPAAPAAHSIAPAPAPSTDFQQFQQPARAQPAAASFQDDFSAQQNSQEFQDFQETPRPAAPQVTRSRGQTRRPSESATRTAQAGLRASQASLSQASPSHAPAPIRVVADQTASVDQTDAQAQEDETFREQAQNAHYSFASSVDDKLTDNSQVRQETRDGLKLAGVYSYSDGYFRRTVHYEADENGYRVTKEDVEPIGDGPMLNPDGAAEVQAQISGQNFGYRITAADIREPNKEEREVTAGKSLSPLQQRFRDDRV